MKNSIHPVHFSYFSQILNKCDRPAVRYGGGLDSKRDFRVTHVATCRRVIGWIAHSQQAMSLQPCVVEEVRPRNAIIWVVSQQPP
eukprot:COSAG02_NODE_10198_length_1996_cov_53.011597_3_plen_84_part_01